MKGVRTFIGIFPPPDIQSAISKIQLSLKTGTAAIRWEVPNKFHITMKFLGNVEPEQFSQLQSFLVHKGQSVGRFKIALTGVGCFPTTHAPKIVWIGSPRDANVPLTNCYEAIESSCIAAGLKKEERQFHPHITLGRVKGKIHANLIQKIENTTFEPLQFLCTELLIMKSDLSPSGSAYSKLFSIPLKH